MKGFAIASAAIVAVGVVVLFLAQLRWDRVETTEAGVKYRLCDLVVSKDPAKGVEVYGMPAVPSDPGASPTELTMVITFEQPTTVDLATGEVGGGTSTVYLDPTTGRVTRDSVQPENRDLFDSILARTRIDRERPKYWPYGEATQVGPHRLAEYAMMRSPDPGSGLATSAGGSFSGEQWEAIANCRSYMRVGSRAGSTAIEVLDERVEPEDREAFDTWASTARR